jgi:hypothetical protein
MATEFDTSIAYGIAICGSFNDIISSSDYVYGVDLRYIGEFVV